MLGLPHCITGFVYFHLLAYHKYTFCITTVLLLFFLLVMDIILSWPGWNTGNIFCSFLQYLFPLAIDKQSVSESEMLKPSLQVLYGSQTGYAQDTAQRIARQAQRKRIEVQLLPLNAYNVVSAATIKQYMLLMYSFPGFMSNCLSLQ